jgi:predicted amidohydrolase
MRTYRAAAIQFEPEHGAKAANIARMERLTREAARAGTKLIVFPEMTTLGLFWESRAHIAPHVEPIPGATTAHFAALAGELDVHIVFGLAEVDPYTNIFYNSAALVGPDGVVGVHRKTYAYLSDPLWAADGDCGFRTWETPLGKLGILICMDANYPESARLLALDGADVLLMPTAWVDEDCPAPLWFQRAFDNDLPIICANRWGEEQGHPFSGGSCILNGDGTLTACAGHGVGDRIVYADLCLREQPSPALERRRPELYGALALNRALWNPVTMQAHFGQPLPEGGLFLTIAVETDMPLNSLDILHTLSNDLPRLIVVPEYAFTAPPTDREDALAVAESVPGATTDRLSAWCAATGDTLVAGLVERDGDRLYATVVLVTPDGLRARARKTHLHPSETRWATPGDTLVWADTPLGRIGLLAGDDLLYPEPARCLAIEGADVICVPAARRQPLPVSKRMIGRDSDTPHWHVPQTRAVENEVVIAYANGGVAGMNGSGVFYGGSLFAAPARAAWADVALDTHTRAALLTVDTFHSEAQPNLLRLKPGIARRLPGLSRPLLESSS